MEKSAQAFLKYMKNIVRECDVTFEDSTIAQWNAVIFSGKDAGNCIDQMAVSFYFPKIQNNKSHLFIYFNKIHLCVL